ncbi:hypothetical protein A5779_00080 [Mycolicibacterium peregrinum]|uniref:Lipoprotein n=1 Tax=Mycolicibacterium peregrinum TaxID=43304 RepID=A0A1A0VZB3_MYCPR|nr:hypothetical protein A5779_00080 [Mycolicibacterium peregrinum]
MLVSVAVTAAVLLFVTGCFVGPGQTDEGTDTVSLLKIEIPDSATNIVGHTDRGVDFLMPNDEWRAYLATYYPDKQLEHLPPLTRYETPAMCLPALRAGVKLSRWTIGEYIQWRNTDKQRLRGVVITPDCEPGKAYVQWVLGDFQ